MSSPDANQGTLLLWELSHRQSTGVTFAEVRGLRAPAVRVELYRGWVHAIDWFAVKWTLGPAPSRGEEQLLALLKRDDVTWTLNDKLPLEKRGRVAPFHPAPVIRNAVAVDADAFRARAGAGRVQLARPPHPSCIGLDEKALLAFIAQPRTLDEIERAQLCLPARALRLLAFLEVVGALTVEGELSESAALALRELGAGASPDEIKRAYRRLARALHPDVHPSASADELRELERRFAEISAAYRRLV